MFRLKEIRIAKKLTQIELAKNLQVSNTTVSNWETGSRQPDFDSLVKIADYFDVSLDYLFGRDYKNRIYNQDNFIFRREQLTPLFEKIVKVDDKYLSNINGYIDALIAINNTKK